MMLPSDKPRRPMLSYRDALTRSTKKERVKRRR